MASRCYRSIPRPGEHIKSGFTCRRWATRWSAIRCMGGHEKRSFGFRVSGFGEKRSGNCCMRGSSASSTQGATTGWSSRPHCRRTSRAGFPQNRRWTPQKKQGDGEAFAWFLPERLGNRSRLTHFLLISFHHSPHQRQAAKAAHLVRCCGWYSNVSRVKRSAGCEEARSSILTVAARVRHARSPRAVVTAS